jgi:hypothetical protein
MVRPGIDTEDAERRTAMLIIRDSCHELHRDGVQGMSALANWVHRPAIDESRQVREATNNEPWGASSTLMQDIANGTFN